MHISKQHCSITVRVFNLVDYTTLKPCSTMWPLRILITRSPTESETTRVLNWEIYNILLFIILLSLIGLFRSLFTLLTIRLPCMDPSCSPIGSG